MLDLPDTSVVKAWLTAALEAGAAHGKTAAALAEHCGVTRQAVNGWLTTGRISKSNLGQAVKFLGSGPLFNAGATVLTANEPAALFAAPTRPPWPFALLSERGLTELPQDIKLRIEGAILALAHTLGVPGRDISGP